MPPRSGGRTQQGRTPAPGQHMPGEFRPPKGSPPAGTMKTARVQSPAPAQSRTRQRKAPARPAGGASPRRIGTAASRSARAAGTGHLTDYQKVIAAEFVLAELLMAATPIATRKNQPGLSPYVPRDMTKLLAIGMTYFLLELLAVGGPGPARFGAWFGGLVLLAAGLNEAANLAKVLALFGGAAPKAGGKSMTRTPAGPAGGQFT